MKSKLLVLAPILLALLCSSSARAANADYNAMLLVRATLLTEEDFLSLEPDQTRKAGMQLAINAAESTRRYDSFWAPDKNSFTVKYSNTVEGVVITSLLTIAKDGKFNEDIIDAIFKDTERQAEKIRAKLEPLAADGNPQEGHEYWLLLDDKGSLIGNLITVTSDKHIVTFVVVGTAFSNANQIDKFLSGKIKKALSFQPDRNFPNYLASTAASAEKPRYTYCKAYTTGGNVISPLMVDRPYLGSEWDAFIKSEGYTRGGCSYAKEDMAAVEEARQSLMIPGGLVYFREVPWPKAGKK